MKEFALWLFICLAILVAGAIGIAKADEPEPQIVQDFIQCTYKPSQSDEVIKYCGTLVGEGSISVRICGINYTVDIVCKPKDAK